VRAAYRSRGGQRIIYIAYFSTFLWRTGSELPKKPLRLYEKGYKRRSDRELGLYTEDEMGRKGTYRRLGGLRRKHVQDFSDTLRRLVLGNWDRCITTGPLSWLPQPMPSTPDGYDL
jgi:hypothetical protein